MTTQLQCLVQQGSLVLSKELIEQTSEEEEANKQSNYSNQFPEIKKGLFNPVLNKKQKTLLLIRFKYRAVHSVFLYDFAQRLVLPQDIM